MEKQLKFWEKHSDCKDTLFVITSILTLIFALYGIDKINKVLVLPISNLDFCPHAWIGSCEYSPWISCGNIKDILYECNSFKDLDIEADIYNRGLALSTNIELRVFLVNATFPRLDNYHTENFVYIFVNNEKIGEERLACPIQYNSSCTISTIINIIKPNDFTNVRFNFRDTEKIIKYPDKIVLELYEDGKKISAKTIKLQLI